MSVYPIRRGGQQDNVMRLPENAGIGARTPHVDDVSAWVRALAYFTPFPVIAQHDCSASKNACAASPHRDLSTHDSRKILVSGTGLCPRLYNIHNLEYPAFFPGVGKFHVNPPEPGVFQKKLLKLLPVDTKHTVGDYSFIRKMNISNHKGIQFKPHNRCLLVPPDEVFSLSSR